MAQPCRDHFYKAADGLDLYARIYPASGDDAGLPLVCLPGLTRNSRDFHELAFHLANQAERPRMVVAFDYRGRGRSGYDPVWTNYNVGVEAGDILAGLASLHLERAIFLGTSRGGLITHILAAMAPAMIAGVILNDIGPEISPAGLMQIVHYLSVPSDPIRSWAEAAEQQRKVHGAAFPALDAADWNRFAMAIYREDDGFIVPDYDPQLRNTLQGIDFGAKLPDLWPQFSLMAQLPLLLVRGENTSLVTRETVDEMRRLHRSMQYLEVPGQGHAPLLETGEIPARISQFCADIDLFR